MSLEPRGMQSLNKDRFSYVGNHIHATHTFDSAYLGNPRHAVIEGS